jgi:hypothetical protein
VYCKSLHFDLQILDESWTEKPTAEKWAAQLGKLGTLRREAAGNVVKSSPIDKDDNNKRANSSAEKEHVRQHRYFMCECSHPTVAHFPQHCTTHPESN